MEHFASLDPWEASDGILCGSGLKSTVWLGAKKGQQAQACDLELINLMIIFLMKVAM